MIITVIAILTVLGTPVTVEFAEEEDYVKRFPEVASKTV